MKKEYIAPQVEVIEMKCEAKLAYTSGGLGAREFEFDDDESVDVFDDPADDIDKIEDIW